jgi:ABC-type molybdenum transport system ATPase subunit/photorepair protein PhrA
MWSGTSRAAHSTTSSTRPRDTRPEIGWVSKPIEGGEDERDKGSEYIGEALKDSISLYKRQHASAAASKEEKRNSQSDPGPLFSLECKTPRTCSVLPGCMSCNALYEGSAC